MVKLINKAWWYRPNAYTTQFELTATWSDGTTSVYTYIKSDSSWILQGDHDGKLLITVPNKEGGSFIIRAYTNNPFTSLNAVYSNATSSNAAEQIDLKKFIYDRTIDNDAIFYRFSGFSGTSHVGWDEDWSVWEIFDFKDLGDVYITNLTEGFKLPERKDPFGPFEGWALLNETCPESEMKNRTTGGSYDVKKMPVSWYMNYTDPAFPTVSKEQEDIMLAMPNIGGVYKLLPLYKTSGMPTYNVDTTDYNAEN